jgi:protocatechuate 3,4-dioxygenase beta subunit
MTWNAQKLTRRRFVAASALSAVAFAAACRDDDDGGETPAAAETSEPAAPTATSEAGTSARATLEPTPSCTDEDDVTIAQTEGPYFSPNSPERASLIEAGVTGETLILKGMVVAKDCRPIARALLDFWQADNDGMYDNEGYRLRGHQFTGDDGSFQLTTVVPGLYPGRTRHIHVKAQAPDQPVLTTQLYFPGEAGNSSDDIFNEALLMDVQKAPGGQAATFTFVLDV